MNRNLKKKSLFFLVLPECFILLLKFALLLKLCQATGYVEIRLKLYLFARKSLVPLETSASSSFSEVLLVYKKIRSFFREANKFQ